MWYKGYKELSRGGERSRQNLATQWYWSVCTSSSSSSFLICVKQTSASRTVGLQIPHFSLHRKTASKKHSFSVSSGQQLSFSLHPAIPWTRCGEQRSNNHAQREGEELQRATEWAEDRNGREDVWDKEGGRERETVWKIKERERENSMVIPSLSSPPLVMKTSTL